MIPVILSGGSGTRLWPVSRMNYPKQFCDFYDRSFLQSSLDRLMDLGTPKILTVESMKSLTMRTLAENNIPLENGLYEPFGKNTAPAIAYLCWSLLKEGKENEVVGVFPADHLITQKETFVEAIKVAEQQAFISSVVTLGIKPRYAATGYGYIELVESLQGNGDSQSVEVKRFCEKPDLETANQFLKSGKHFWNSGIFVFQVKKMVEAINELLPDLWGRINGLKADGSNLSHVYANLESMSIDYGVMEKLKDQVCIPVEMGWSDVGSWDEVSRLSEQPGMSAGSKAKVLNMESSGNYVFSQKEKVVGLIGMDDVIVVDTSDAMLLVKKGMSQQVKDLVTEIRSQSMTSADEHPFEVRPWGGFEILSEFSGCKVKKLIIEKGHQMSYQSHERRDEHWVVVSGQVQVMLEGETTDYKAGQSFVIPKTKKHRITNVGNGPLTLIEVQLGDYFGEDDIVRYSDDYGRETN